MTSTILLYSYFQFNNKVIKIRFPKRISSLQKGHNFCETKYVAMFYGLRRTVTSFCYRKIHDAAFGTHSNDGVRCFVKTKKWCNVD